jgi:hypothetical protein
MLAKMNKEQMMTDLLHPSSSSEPKINVDLTPIVQFNIHSNNYIIERLSIRPLEAVEAHFDFVIERKYLIAQKPDWQVLYRSMFHLQDLKNLQSVLGQLLLWEK